jgi:hypothetical protein
VPTSIPDVNDSGTAAFRATLDAGGSGVFLGNGGPTTTVATTAGPYSIFHISPDINNSGRGGPA